MIFFNFYTSGASVLQKLLFSMVVKNRVFLYFRARGEVQHSDPRSLFIERPPWAHVHYVCPQTWFNEARGLSLATGFLNENERLAYFAIVVWSVFYYGLYQEFKDKRDDGVMCTRKEIKSGLN